jgi:hypothetical protein
LINSPPAIPFIVRQAANTPVIDNTFSPATAFAKLDTAVAISMQTLNRSSSNPWLFVALILQFLN